MAFSKNARVRVTSQKSEYRNKLGTVEKPAAASPVGLNEVRIDGAPKGRVAHFSDAELGTTTHDAPVNYED